MFKLSLESVDLVDGLTYGLFAGRIWTLISRLSANIWRFGSQYNLDEGNTGYFRYVGFQSASVCRLDRRFGAKGGRHFHESIKMRSPSTYKVKYWIEAVMKHFSYEATQVNEKFESRIIW
jgi:hypothetical protein